MWRCHTVIVHILSQTPVKAALRYQIISISRKNSRFSPLLTASCNKPLICMLLTCLASFYSHQVLQVTLSFVWSVFAVGATAHMCWVTFLSGESSTWMQDQKTKQKHNLPLKETKSLSTKQTQLCDNIIKLFRASPALFARKQCSGGGAGECWSHSTAGNGPHTIPLHKTALRLAEVM